jgi:hypothetical protein
VMTRAGMSFPRRVRGEHIGRVVGAIRNGAKRTHGLSCINVLKEDDKGTIQIPGVF